MFDEVNGLPAHPLFVHAPVILIPLTVLIGLAYVALPKWRKYLGWQLALLAVASAGSAVAAVQSGAAFEKSVGATPEFQPRIDEHAALGTTLRNFTLVLFVVAVALVVVDHLRRRRAAVTAGDDDSGDGGSATGGGHATALNVSSVVLSVGLVALALLAAVWVFRTGDSGAQMVWGNTGG